MFEPRPRTSPRSCDLSVRSRGAHPAEARSAATGGGAANLTVTAWTSGISRSRRDRPASASSRRNWRRLTISKLAYNKRVVDRLCQVVVISCRNKVGLDLQVDLEGGRCPARL